MTTTSRAWHRVRRGWDRLVERARGRAVPVRAGLPARSPAATQRPTFEVLESEHEVLVRCDVPGVPRDAFDVRVVDGEQLVVAADPHRRGTVELPAPVVTRGAFGSLRRGVLTLHLPKVRPPHARPLRAAA